jgi:hypothetical protein
MPTVLRVGPYRFFFYSGDGNEPPHIHIEHDATSPSSARSGSARAEPGILTSGVSDISRLVNEHAQELLEAWNDYFG